MKHGKKPMVAQRKFMEGWKLNPTKWLVVKDTPVEMVLQHRNFDRETRQLPKRKEDHNG